MQVSIQKSGISTLIRFWVNLILNITLFQCYYCNPIYQFFSETKKIKKFEKFKKINKKRNLLYLNILSDS